MFFVVSKVLGFLVHPFELFFVVCIAAATVRRRRPRLARGLVVASVSALYLLSVRPVADLILYPLEGPFQERVEPERVDAILVLGGSRNMAEGRGRVELNSAADRFVYGVLLAREHPEAILIFSGGTASLFDKSNLEAPSLKKLAVQFGIEPERIIAESASRNTRENAMECASIVRERGLSHTVLITSAYHMKRSLGCFHQAGLYPHPYAVDFEMKYPGYDVFVFIPGVEHLLDTSHAIREYVGLVTYWLKGYI